MNTNQLKGTWHEIKGEVKKQWGKLTDDDIQTIDGNYEKFCGTLQKTYGYTEEEAKKNIDSFLDKTKHH